MIYQLTSLADGRTWREYTLEDRTKFLENPLKGIHAWWQDTIVEANAIKSRGTTSPAARKKRRLLELASLLEACIRHPELWHMEAMDLTTPTLFVRLWPLPTAPTHAAKPPSSPAI